MPTKWDHSELLEGHIPDMNKSKIYNLCDSIKEHTDIMNNHYMGHRKPEYLKNNTPVCGTLDGSVTAKTIDNHKSRKGHHDP